MNEQASEVNTDSEPIKEATQPVEQGTEPTQQPQTDDLLSRVSKFVIEKDPANKPEDNQGGSQFNSAELEATINGIEDPELRSKMDGLRKSLVSGANNKFQEIATLRKEMQSFMESKRPGNEDWTPERVQALANDPKFIQAAQAVAGTEETDEYSSLSESEKQNLKEMQNEIARLKELNNKALQTQQQQLREQQHQQLASKYANYDPKEIDSITYEMLEGKIQATPEHIYKAFKYEENIQKAYELGKKDEREGITTKIQSTSPEGISASHSSEPIVAEEGESSKSFFDKIIAKNLKLHKARS